ncbi:Glycoside hydrolase superfamily [Lactarius tabidus]
MRSLLQNIALITLSLSLSVAGSLAPNGGSEPALVKRASPQGCDISNHQGTLNWVTIKSQGVEFVYIKATEGTTFIDAYFNQNYVGATNNKIIRGAYHFAHPNISTGAVQANYFLAHGGGWTADGMTLPGAIDLEGDCYGLTASQMVSWIQDFSNTYNSTTHRYAAFSFIFRFIYATTNWWQQCTGNSAAFAKNNPLWIASWASAIGTLPAGWSYTTFWQFADNGTFPGDQDLFNGDAAGLSRIPVASFNMRSLLQSITLTALSLSLGVAGTPAPHRESQPRLVKRADPQGCDVSNWQGSNLNWATIKSEGAKFAYIKATEGTTFIDPDFNHNYIGATDNKIIRGGYHFARPDTSTGAAQAKYFLAHGGRWSADGLTLPGAIDLEGAPLYSAPDMFRLSDSHFYVQGDCSGLTASQMVSWIKDFSNTYHSVTTRYPVIYTTTSWWEECTGNSAAFGSDNPLWIAHWASSIGTLPAGWSYTTFWQYADSGTFPGDQDLFNGDAAGLSRYVSQCIYLPSFMRRLMAFIFRMALGS